MGQQPGPTSAHTMRLAVLGPQSVERLGEWAARYFAAVPGAPPKATPPVRRPVWAQTGRRVTVRPIANLRQLHFVWELPPPKAPLQFSLLLKGESDALGPRDFPHQRGALQPVLPEYRAMVPGYLSYVLAGSGQGSVYAALKASGWAEAVDLDLRFVRAWVPALLCLDGFYDFRYKKIHLKCVIF